MNHHKLPHHVGRRRPGAAAAQTVVQPLWDAPCACCTA